MNFYSKSIKNYFYSKLDYIYDNPLLLVKFAAILMCAWCKGRLIEF